MKTRQNNIRTDTASLHHPTKAKASSHDLQISRCHPQIDIQYSRLCLSSGILMAHYEKAEEPQ